MRVALAALTIAVCAAAPAGAQEAAPDPWENFNRDMFALHEAIDGAVLEPVARGYRAVTTDGVRTSVRSFLHNLRSPVIFANDVLQGEALRAGVTAARFGVNTTVGLAGLFDPAAQLGLPRHDEDFGQTLGVWGVGPGPYIFIPGLGPSTLRDGAGRIVDMAFDPFNWAEFDEADDVRLGRAIVTGVSAREDLLDAVDDVRRTSLDPYATIRTSYGLLRASAIQNGRGHGQDLPDLDEILGLTDEADVGNPQHAEPAAPNPLADAPAAPTSEDQTGVVP